MTVPSDADLGVLARDVGQRLQQAALQLVTAESCSGGWIAKAMTDVAGSSAFFDCGMVVYSYEAKQRLLGVRAQTLEQFGAVSRETVLEMVSGALVNSGAGMAVAVTGIAGPGGGGGTAMTMTKHHLTLARTLGVAIIATVGLGGCATYKDEFASINSRLDQLDVKVQGAAQSAESANQSAQQANQRLDQIEGRVQQLEKAPRRQPRG